MKRDEAALESRADLQGYANSYHGLDGDWSTFSLPLTAPPSRSMDKKKRHRNNLGRYSPPDTTVSTAEDTFLCVQYRRYTKTEASFVYFSLGLGYSSS